MTKITIFSCILLLCATASGAEEKELTVELTVPDSAWVVSIHGVHEVGNELWVISSVSRDPDAMGAQVISTVKDSVKLAAPDLPVKNYIIGKAWDWENKEPYTFIEDLKQIEQELAYGKLLYRATKQGPRN
jgi:hypothetical protein